MFHSKEVKQQLEQANQMKAQVTEYSRVLNSISADTLEARVEVDQLGMSASRMDRSLTRVVDYARDTKENQESVSSELDEMTEQIGEAITWVEDFADKHDKKCAFVEKVQEEMNELQEQSKHYTNLSKTMSDLSAKEGTQLVAAISKLKSLESFAGTIRTLALQSAIDAGRMGEEATQYIKTAEEIRSLSSDFANEGQDLIKELEEAKAADEERDQQMHSFISLLRENTVLLGKIATQAKDEKQQNCFDAVELEKELTAIKTRLNDIQAQLQQGAQQQGKIMDEMESVGTCFMEQQDSTAKIEKRIENTKRMLSEIDNKYEAEEIRG